LGFEEFRQRRHMKDR